MRDVHEICEICTRFNGFSQGVTESWGVKLRVSGYNSPKYSAPHSGETMRRTPKRAGGPLSPCQVWWARILPAENVEFLSVCLSVYHASERQSLCARFRHEGVGIQKQF